MLRKGFAGLSVGFAEIGREFGTMELSPFKRRTRERFDELADARDSWREKNGYYHEFLTRYLRSIIPAGKKVLELGCGTGGLLASLEPSFGVGIDLSARMVELARAKYPHLSFYQADAENRKTWPFEETFDFVVVSDTIGLLEDVQTAFDELHGCCDESTRVVVTYYNFMWEPILLLGERFGWKMPQPAQSWLSPADIENLLFLADFETIKKESRLVFPKRVPIGQRFLEAISTLPGLSKLSLCHFIVARPVKSALNGEKNSISVIVPCLNEKGNIEPAVKRIPDLGEHTEIIFVDGKSKDGTLDEVRRIAEKYRHRDIKLLIQEGKGKGDAVRKGFANAQGDILVILDADLTVPPEDLPKFYQAIISGKGEFINGCRLIYPMEKQAMRLLNLFGNKFFSLAFSWLLNQRIKDTLCGTKAITRKNYDRLAANRAYFGDFDPFGDFDLLFGASKLNLKILEVPIRYGARSYGETQISRFRHGFLLLRMCMLAARKLKFG